MTPTEQGEPKFKVGQVVASAFIKPTEYFVITKIRNEGRKDPSYEDEFMYFTPKTGWWAEWGIRALTRKEAGR